MGLSLVVSLFFKYILTYNCVGIFSSGWCGFEFGAGGDSNSDSVSGEKKQIGQAKRRISEAETVKIHQEIASK